MHPWVFGVCQDGNTQIQRVGTIRTRAWREKLDCSCRENSSSAMAEKGQDSFILCGCTELHFRMVSCPAVIISSRVQLWLSGICSKASVSSASAVALSQSAFPGNTVPEISSKKDICLISYFSFWNLRFRSFCQPACSPIAFQI